MRGYVYLVLAILAVLGLLIFTLAVTTPAHQISENPFDDVYEVRYSEKEYMVELTTKEIPTVEGNYLKIINYWWQQYDEEGNEEWTRYDSEYYFVLIPINSAVVVRHIPDIDNTAAVVKMWTWRQYLEELIDNGN